MPGAEIGTDRLAAGQPATAPEERAAGAVMWYTSGTTGFPKGVQRPLPGAEPEAIVPLYTWFLGEVLDLRPGDGVHLVTSPMYHSAPCAHTQFALHLGHTVVIAPRFEPAAVLELIDRHRVTNAMMVPTMFHRMLRLPAEVRQRYDVSSPPAGHPHRRRLPGRGQAGDHGLVGAGAVRVLRLHRVHHRLLRQAARLAGQARHRRPARAHVRGEDPRRGGGGAARRASPA